MMNCAVFTAMSWFTPFAFAHSPGVLRFPCCCAFLIRLILYARWSVSLGSMQKMPSKNSAITAHHTDRGCSIDTRIHSCNGPDMNCCIAKFYFFLKRETQKLFFATLLKCWLALLTVLAAPFDVIHIGLAEVHRDPVPCVADIDLQLCLISICPVIHDLRYMDGNTCPALGMDRAFPAGLLFQFIRLLLQEETLPTASLTAPLRR